MQMTTPRYLPIADHGVIGDLRTVALVGTNGGSSIWRMCSRVTPSSAATLSAVCAARPNRSSITRRPRSGRSASRASSSSSWDSATSASSRVGRRRVDQDVELRRVFLGGEGLVEGRDRLEGRLRLLDLLHQDA
jgi:hypothetical protein